MSRVPVRWRLTLAFAAVMAIVLVATGAFVHQRQRSNLDDATQTALQARADDVAALAQQSDRSLRDARPGAGRRRPQLAQLVDSSGSVLARTPGLTSRPLLGASELAAARRGHPVRAAVTLAGDNPVRLLAQGVDAQGRRLVVVVGQSLEERNHALADLDGVLLLGGPAALVLASIAGWFLIGAALRPVETMRRRADAISVGDLDQRLPPVTARDELGRLQHTLNEMLGRIQASVARERTFVSDASHELRSPLAALRTELELIARDRPAGAALQRATGSAIEETDRLSRMAEDLLLLSRADDHRLALRPRRVSAGELLEDAAERFARSPAEADLQVVADGAAHAQVNADSDRIGQTLDNLLENARRYASRSITLSAHADAASVDLHVTDDGPGFPPEFLPSAWERFARADVGRTEDGAGLGLAIVRTIAEAHGGHARATNLAGGGADVWISLPRAARGA
jgi:two-component system, OmpR family, sensor kinase